MAVYINNIIATGTVRIYGISSEPEIFAGTNLTLRIPVYFAGDPNTFVSIAENSLPTEFVESDTNVFSSTNLETLPINFLGEI